MGLCKVVFNNFANIFMGRRKTILENVCIEGVAAEGKCIARRDGMVIFTTGLVPGDVADLLVTKKKKQFLEARPVKIIKLSEERTTPFCEHYEACGGCKWQHLPYHLQLKYKQQQVKDQLERIGKLDIPQVLPIIGSAKSEFYRNKLEFTFSASRWLAHEEIEMESELDRRALGFHVAGRYNRVVDVNKCYLQGDPSNAIRNFVRDFSKQNDFNFYDSEIHQGFMRNLIVRNSNLGELMVIVQFGRNEPENIKTMLEAIDSEFPDITSLNYVINTKKNDTFYDLEIINWKGRAFIFERLGNLRYKISPKSFFQTNSAQAENLYEKTKEFAALEGNEIVYDLYTGTGTIANFMADSAKLVVGIENIEQAIKDARENSELNNISNTVFLAGDARELFSQDTFVKYGPPEVVITDPPRAGMHQDIVETILAARPKKIVYVSCNPATQARDLALLAEDYDVVKIQPVDMFPHTHHVENIVALKLKPI